MFLGTNFFELMWDICFCFCFERIDLFACPFFRSCFGGVSHAFFARVVFFPVLCVSRALLVCPFGSFVFVFLFFLRVRVALMYGCCDRVLPFVIAVVLFPWQEQTLRDIITEPRGRTRSIVVTPEVRQKTYIPDRTRQTATAANHGVLQQSKGTVYNDRRVLQQSFIDTRDVVPRTSAINQKCLPCRHYVRGAPFFFFFPKADLYAPPQKMAFENNEKRKPINNFHGLL